MAPVFEGLQRQREVQQDAFFVFGKDRKDAHLEQVVADLFEDRRVALAIDDRLVDPRGPLAFNQLALDQFVGRHVHGKPADRSPVRQVEHERAFLLARERIVERLVDLHQRHRRLQHDVDVVAGDVQADGRVALHVLDHQLA